MLKQVDIKDVLLNRIKASGYELVRIGDVQEREEWMHNDGRILRAIGYVEGFYPIVRPLPPSLVPLGPEDVVPGKTLIRGSKWTQNEVSLVVHRDGGEIVFLIGKSTHSLTYQQLGEKDYWLHSNDHGVTWQKCSKPASPA